MSLLRPPVGLLPVLASLSLLSPAGRSQECVMPASPHPIEALQPDGTRIVLHLRGSGGAAWHEDERGFAVVRHEGRWVYARSSADGTLAATGLVAGVDDPLAAGLAPGVPAIGRSTGGAALDSTARMQRMTSPLRDAARSRTRRVFGGAGSVKNLVILLLFSDHGPSGQDRTLPSSADVGTIMNAVGGDPTLAPTGSVRDHYLETSYGQFTVDSTVVAWVTLPETEIYYANGSSGLTTLTWDLITDGLNLADGAVDFSEFDEDGDGVVDAITFLHSGYGAEWGGTDVYGTFYTDRIWSHKWQIPTWTSAEGVTVSDYNISPALWGLDGSEAGHIGVVVHELGHFFGLPDLYDTGGIGDPSQGIGNWCVMAGGAWGFDGSQQYPSHMSAWCKLKLGWAAPQRILPDTHVAPEVETTSTIFMIDNGYPPGEYLLIENRQPEGFDAVIPQGGLAIWHIDEAKGSFGWNNPNADEGYPGQAGWPGNNSHYRVALLQADGFYDMEQNFDRGDAADIYHAAGVSQLDGTTTPSTDGYQQGMIVANGNEISNVGVSGSNVSFDYANPAAPTITTASLPDAERDAPYSQALAATGGTAPLRWSETLAVPGYSLTDLGPQSWAAGGTAQGWNLDEGMWLLDLPFAFPFYETSYTRVYVCSNGYLELWPAETEPWPTVHILRNTARIAPLWYDLTTEPAGRDVYVDTSVTGQVRIRWDAETYSTADPCNFAVVLHDDGRIELQYGSGNTGIDPVVGISRGHGGLYTIAGTHTGNPDLGGASFLRFTRTGSQLPPGLAISSAGVLAGTPTAAGTWEPVFRVMDDEYHYDERTLMITVLDPGGPSFCNAADGSHASCPCSNPGNPDSGCDIAQGTGGVRLDVVAQQTSPPNRATVTGTGYPVAALPGAVVIRAASLDSAAPVAFGDGLRCIATPLVRLAGEVAVGGTSTHTFGHGAGAGSGTFYYQIWFRNQPAMYCTPDGFNLTNGRTMTW